MAAIRYFFSYARADAQFVLKLATELRSVGAGVWVDQLDIMAGQRWDHAVEDALKNCQGMIIVLSPHSVASVNVMDEVSYALGKAKPIVPILLRPCEIPFRLQRLQQVDFTGDYDAGFTRLLRDLKIERPAPAEATQPRRERQAPQVFAEPLIARDNTQSASTVTQGRVVPDSAKQSFIVKHPRLMSALIGAAIGAVWGLIIGATFGRSDDLIAAPLLTGIVGAISGIISGMNRKVLVVTVVCIVVGSVLWWTTATPIARSDNRVGILFRGSSLGAIGGAIVGVVLKKLLKWT